MKQYPLLSRCGYMIQLDLPPSDSNLTYDLKIDNLPGGPDTFETVLKFCYGHPIDLTPTNVAPLRCASEFLEMTEELEPNNLISKTEAFLTFSLSSWRNSIAVLNSCQSLSAWADNLQITRRCTDSIASKAVHGDYDQWWLDEVSTLHIDHFVKIVTAMRAKGVAPEMVGACIVHYAERWVPGFEGECEGHGGRSELQLSILSGRRSSEVGVLHNRDRRLMVESLVSILPQDRGVVSCGFLLRMLKMAVVYSVSPALVSELEKRVGMVLEDATVSDLLIPNYVHGDGALHGR